jgi:ATP-dependent Zn protease
MMVTRYGMGRRMVSVDRERLIGGFDEIDAEVADLIEAALKSARKLVTDHRALLTRIVNELLEEETLHTERLVELRQEHQKTFRRPALRRKRVTDKG